MIMEDHDFLSCGWLSNPGPNHEIVLSTRVRIARNVEGFPFSHWASTGELARLVSSCSAAIRKTTLLSGAEEIHLEEVNELDLAFLRERHQISAEMVHSQNQRSVFVAPDQRVAAMVAEEDHLRLQVLSPGLDLKTAWETCDSLDDELGKRLAYAYSDRLGYLTACPTNVGTGLRCSVMVHLPALVMTRQIQKMINAVSQLGMTVRGPSGEGSEIKGNLFQISNQVTLGVTEAEIIERLSLLTEQIIDMEAKAVSQLMNEAEEDIEDRVFRAYSILTSARKLNSKETLELLSPVRLGIRTGLLKEASLNAINEIFLCTRPAHLQKKAGREMGERERDIFRAQFIRDRFKPSPC